MKEMNRFKIFQNCHVCGQSFESDYKLIKHLSRFHYSYNNYEINPNIHSSCSCGHSNSSDNVTNN